MSEPSLSDLIKQLTRIRIQEAQVLNQIERAARALDQIEQAAHREVREARAAPAAVPGRRNAHRNVFQPGNRVQITNGVRAGQMTTGTVTGVTASRVNITTDDGSRTWRAHHNVTFV
jgi:hypothetical protein